MRVEAAPLHPSDIAQVLMSGDLSRAERQGDALIMPLREAARLASTARPGQINVAGGEGAGTVIAVGALADNGLVGGAVAAMGGGMFADYRVLKVSHVKLLPAGATARQGAAISTNPLTALAMVGSMRNDGASALVHTAAASASARFCSASASRTASR